MNPFLLVFLDSCTFPRFRIPIAIGTAGQACTPVSVNFSGAGLCL